MRYYVTDDRGIVQDDQLTEARARQVGQHLVDAGRSDYAAVFRHGPPSDPDRYDRKPAFYVRPAGAASPRPPITATSPGIAEAAARFHVDAGALAAVLDAALPKVAAGMDPEAALLAAMAERRAVLTELAAGVSPFAQAARRAISTAVYAELRAATP